MTNCKFCGIQLNALNLSDVEPSCCGNCCDEKLNEILRIGIDYETPVVLHGDEV